MTPEEIVKSIFSIDNPNHIETDLGMLIILVKEAYNKAIEDAAEKGIKFAKHYNLSSELTEMGKESILKLLKK